ncbi:VWA domain-containing protein [Saccharopolyspora sp. K220]|uniref:VWA domain-containing protein n=1 Tax=Saccharopolyspora soli TaxID=2926618 RepID=UPI001F55C9B2|nr:VWA domain-containing protein [Saccharopolyspora soli]MCI2418423.1 VWA domain-containing protein [Saccharopolyspora soli]
MSLAGFASPWWLLLLAVLGALVVGYLLAQRSRRRRVLRFANLAMLDRVMPRRRGWLRHAPVALLGVAMVLLVSLSMQATDIEPNRLVAAQDAAKRFVQQMTPGINLGLVAFSGTATTLVMPTTDRTAMIQAVDALKLSEATATGDGLHAAMNAIDSFGKMLSGPTGPAPARIVLMSDGKQTIPQDGENSPNGSFTRAREAKDANIPISTIAFGTQHGTVEIDGKQEPVPADIPAMQEIAKLSGGEYYEAASAPELRRVYDTLSEQIGYETKHTDASKPWLILGTLTALIAAGWSLLIGQRLP